MAKRKRLTPPQGAYLGPAPETKSMASQIPVGVVPARKAAPPIAQVAGDISATAALTELTELVARARAEGRMILSLDLSEIAADHLVRDRMVMEEEDLDSLRQSLAARGQQTPIEVVDRGPDASPRYGLISGWRRVTALGQLAQAGAGAKGQAPGHVLALVRAPADASEAYVAMIEENEIRVGLSNYERARIVARAVEQGIYSDAGQGLRTLFGNVPRAKRSKIKSFLKIVAALDDALRFPAAIPERLGLELAKALEDPALPARIRAALARTPPEQAAEELALLAQCCAQGAPAPASDPAEAGPDAGTDSGPDSGPETGTGIGPDTGTDTGTDAGIDTGPSAARPALRVSLRRGELVLSGSRVDSVLKDDLLRWLQARGYLAE